MSNLVTFVFGGVTGQALCVAVVQEGAHVPPVRRTIVRGPDWSDHASSKSLNRAFRAGAGFRAKRPTLATSKRASRRATDCFSAGLDILPCYS